MTRYRNKPVEVEAWQVGSISCPAWAEYARRFANSGDWLILESSYIRGKKLFYEVGIVDRFEFEQAYEVVE